MRICRVFVASVLIGMAGCQPSAEKPVVEENEMPASAALESLIRQYVDVEWAKNKPGELRDVSAEAFLQEIDMQRQQPIVEFTRRRRLAEPFDVLCANRGDFLHADEVAQDVCRPARIHAHFQFRGICSRKFGRLRRATCRGISLSIAAC